MFRPCQEQILHWKGFLTQIEQEFLNFTHLISFRSLYMVCPFLVNIKSQCLQNLGSTLLLHTKNDCTSGLHISGLHSSSNDLCELFLPKRSPGLRRFVPTYATSTQCQATLGEFPGTETMGLLSSGGRPEVRREQSFIFSARGLY